MTIHGVASNKLERRPKNRGFDVMEGCRRMLILGETHLLAAAPVHG